jgi:hypothetical protein
MLQANGSDRVVHMQNGNITLIVALAGAVGAVCATLIGGLFTIWGQYLTRRSEERRHFMDLCFKVASENMVRDIENANTAGQAIAPIDLYIIHMMTLISLLRSGKLTQQEMINRWVETKHTTRAAFEAAVQEDEKRGRR